SDDRLGGNSGHRHRRKGAAARETRGGLDDARGLSRRRGSQPRGFGNHCGGHHSGRARNDGRARHRGGRGGLPLRLPVRCRRRAADRARRARGQPRADRRARRSLLHDRERDRSAACGHRGRARAAVEIAQACLRRDGQADAELLHAGRRRSAQPPARDRRDDREGLRTLRTSHRDADARGRWKHSSAGSVRRDRAGRSRARAGRGRRDPDGVSRARGLDYRRARHRRREARDDAGGIHRRYARRDVRPARRVQSARAVQSGQDRSVVEVMRRSHQAATARRRMSAAKFEGMSAAKAEGTSAAKLEGMSAAKANGTSAAETSAARPRLDLAAFPSLGPGQLRPGRDVDEIDGMLPQAVITAREPAHVIATIEEARAKRLGVVTSGGATMLHIGAPPRAYDVRLSMTAIGRILATNATGGLRHGFGLPRDLVLGMTAIDGCGRTLVCGGRVVKNVAGYDLVRLLTGSWGGLAIITQATLRTHPLPEAGATLVFEFVSPAELDAARGSLLGQSLPLAAVDFAVDMSEATMLWILAVRVEGTEQEVAVQGDRVCAAVGRQPSDAVEDWTSPAHIDAPGGATLRIATPPASIVGTVRSVLGKLKETASRLGRTPLLVAGHLGAGIARFHLASSSEDAGGSATRPAFGNPVDVAALQSLLAATEPDGVIATRVIERAPVSIKQGHQVWGAPPASLPLMRAVKRRLDPADALSPGRFVGGL